MEDDLRIAILLVLFNLLIAAGCWSLGCRAATECVALLDTSVMT